MNGWLPSLVLLLSLSSQTPLTVDAYVRPSSELALGITTVSASRDFGPMQFQFAAEAEWDLQDATLVPVDVTLVHANALLSWLTLYGGVATNVTIERFASESGPPQTTIILAAAFRAGATVHVSGRLAVAVDLEYSAPGVRIVAA